MHDFNDQYYVVRGPKGVDPVTLYLRQTDRSWLLSPGDEELALGGEPLFLEDAFREEFIAAGINNVPEKAHLHIGNLVVNKDIFMDLVDFEIRYFQLFPTVIVDNEDKFHEGYWYLNCYDRLPALDYANSDIDDFDPGDERHDFKRYCLSEPVMNALDEEERLIFRAYGPDRAEIFVHQKIVDIFNAHNVDTVTFYKLSEYEFGCEY
uniref:hypothetical protein n=1 Tax=Thaumasiovibrio occultus TaxID=1891184 RepID=UPI000B36208B|nr:hypothetical protein [Thaumasiovibrio occultus]